MEGQAGVQHRWQRRAMNALAGGVSSNTRLLNPHLIISRGEGCRIWDADGRDYFDYLLGQGPNFLGYAPPRVVEKVIAAQRAGVIYAATHTSEVEAAERVLGAVGWAETMRFGSSSTEMVQAALKIARAATGREYVLRFHGHYHGWMDNIHTSTQDHEAVPASKGQLPSALREVITIDWNDLAAFERVMIERGSQIAAVIMEPLMLNAGVIKPAPNYLEGVARICAEKGSVLVFDETISGFRVALGGAAERFGVQPDLAIYGKAMAAGWPCAALVGRRDLFADVATGVVTHAGTFNGNTIATAAVLASLDELEGGDVYARVEQVGGKLIAALRSLALEHGLGMHWQGLPMAFHASFAPSDVEITRYEQLQNIDQHRYRALARALIDSGVWVAYRGIWYVSAAHTERDMDESLERIDEAFRAFSRSPAPAIM